MSEHGGKRVAVFHPTHWEHAGWLPLMAVLAALFVIAAWRARSL